MEKCLTMMPSAITASIVGLTTLAALGAGPLLVSAHHSSYINRVD